MPTDADIIRVLVWVIGATGGALCGVGVYAAKAIVDRIGKMETAMRHEMRLFDRRITRVETILRVPPAEVDADATGAPH